MYNGFNYNQTYYNPTLESRINSLTQYQQTYPQNFPQCGQNFQTTPQKTIHQVASIEEIKAYTPSFDGSKSYFEELSTGNIYIKYLGINGLPVLEVYKKTETPLKNENDFINRTEFEEIKTKLEKYESVLNELIGGDTNEPNATATNV